MENKITKLGLLGLTALLSAALLPACGPPANNANQANTGNTGANKANTGNTSTGAKALTGCDDKAINDAIGARVKDKNSEFYKIRRQINWNSDGCVVYLYGYVHFEGESNPETNERYLALIDLALKTDDVKGTNSKNLKHYKADFGHNQPEPGVCQGDYVPCGDICVPPGTCNNGELPPLVTASPTPRP